MFSFLSEACWKTASPSEVILNLYLQYLNQLSEMKILSYCAALSYAFICTVYAYYVYAFFNG